MFRIKTKRRNVSKRVKIPHCRLGIVSYARLSRTFSSLVCLFVTQESRALSPLLFVCLLPKNLVHCFFSCLFVCYAKFSCTVLLLFICLLRENLAHCIFPCLFVCCAQILHHVSSLVCLRYARISRSVSSLVCLFVC